MGTKILPPLESLVEKFKELSQNLPKVGLRLLQVTPTANDHMIFILVDSSNDKIEFFMCNYDIILDGWHEVSQFSNKGKYFYEGIGRNFLKSCGVSTWAENPIDITINKDVHDLMDKWQGSNKKFIEYCFI